MVVPLYLAVERGFGLLLVNFTAKLINFDSYFALGWG